MSALDCLVRLPWPVIVLSMVLAACSSSPRASTGSAAALSADDLASAKALFYRATAGDRDALSKAAGWLEAAHRGDPADTQIAAYLGACRLLSADAATWPWEKGRLSKEGLTMLEQAVAGAPDDLEIRFVRGMTSYRLPKFMGRREVAAGDLARVAREAPRAVREGRLPPNLATAALYHHGLVLEEDGDAAGARAAWKEAVALAPSTAGAESALLRLRQR